VQKLCGGALTGKTGIGRGAGRLTNEPTDSSRTPKEPAPASEPTEERHGDQNSIGVLLTRERNTGGATSRDKAKNCGATKIQLATTTTRSEKQIAGNKILERRRNEELTTIQFCRTEEGKNELHIQNAKIKFSIKNQQDYNESMEFTTPPPLFDWKLKIILSTLLFYKVRNEIREMTRSL
jgi:hypothetical protein